MRSYELFLTDECTRSCTFCDIPKCGFSSTKNDVEKFISYVKNIESKKSSFNISFYGGEPLLHADSIHEVCNSFSEYPYCQFCMTTNADLIDHLDKNKLPVSFSLNISAYDIFKDVNKYVKIAKYYLPMKIMFRFTFDDSTIHYIDKFKSLCNSNSLEYDAVFSHAAKSWTNISLDDFKVALCKFYSSELDAFYKSSSFMPRASVRTYFGRFVQSLFDKNMKDISCVSEPKSVIYAGEDIGPCIRLRGTNEVVYPKRCKKCRYSRCCSKGCIAEYHNNDIDEKLCLINKVAYEQIEMFIDMHKDDYRLKQILCYAVNDIHNIYRK